MTVIEKDGYIFNVDAEKTRGYYDSHSLCDCSGCRNFYAQIKGKYPELEAFLAEFGVDIVRPDEIAWWAIDGQMEYHPWYTVTGAMVTPGEYQRKFGEVALSISEGDTPLDYVPNEQTEPYFVISVDTFFLPWVLDETFPAEDVPPRISVFQKLRNFFEGRRKL